jgi:hypothetical protein
MDFTLLSLLLFGIFAWFMWKTDFEHPIAGITIFIIFITVFSTNFPQVLDLSSIFNSTWEENSTLNVTQNQTPNPYLTNLTQPNIIEAKEPWSNDWLK